MPGDHEWQEEWRSFEKTIKSEARFFSRTAAAQLGELFDSIDKMRTAKGNPLVVDAGPKTKVTHFYRARVFQSDKQLVKALMRPDQELSAPPSELAGAGRMNAKGISAFYGATTIEIALAEVRPPVGSQVAVARFELTRPVRLLDLAALSDVRELGSIFDPTYAHRLGRMTFLRSLSARIARPVMPDDQETEYLPTQAIADFLATEGKVPIDGILFPSVQVGGEGLNAVLFHKAARCAEIEIPEGTELSAQTYTTYEDGPEPDYTVIEEVPVPDEDQAEEKPFSPFEAVGGSWEDWSETDGRDETLRIDLESVRVHQVNAVKIDTTDYQVDRHRWEKKEPPF